MRILIVNKFLYPNGGSETYIFKIGEQLQKMGHEVQYFGMEHEGRIVGNHAESYTSNMDFHTGKIQKLLYPFKIIYSREARKKIRRVLDDFKPDVVHLNNFNFQLTPSIIYEIRKFEKQNSQKVKIVFTAHDYQLVCPNHLLQQPDGQLCTKCLEGKRNLWNCAKYKCIHASFVKSILGSIEGIVYKKLKTYREIDLIICPSHFMKEKLAANSDLKDRLIVMHNFVDADKKNVSETGKKDYVLYFGRLCKEKGVETLLQVCEKLPEIPFVFAGKGPLEEKVKTLPNVDYKGFLDEEEMKKIIEQARFTIFPSEWYENCPFSVIESQIYGTPVIGSDLGGTPELIEAGKTGELFEAGNASELQEKVTLFWNEKSDLLDKYTSNCKELSFSNTEEYCKKLLSECYCNNK